MPDTFLAIQTLGFATGTALFGLLAVLSSRAIRFSDDANLGFHSALLGLLWNTGMLVEFVGRLAGVRLSSPPMRLVTAAAYVALALLPTVFLSAALSRYAKRQSLNHQQWLLFFSYGIAVVLTFNLLAYGLGFIEWLFFSRSLKVIAYNLVLHLIVISFLFRRTQDFPTRVFVKTELWLLVGLALTLMLSIHTVFDPPTERVIRVISQQSGIPIALTAIASLSRFRFADVFIKRGFTMLAAVVTVLLYSLFIVRPLLRLVRASARYPEAASWVMMTLLGCALLLVFPAMQRWIYRVTDRKLFRRPDYHQLGQTLAHEMEQVRDEQQLFTMLKERLQSVLQTESVRIVPSDSLESEATEDAELILPIQVNAYVAYRLVIAPGREGRKLLSDELVFLASLTERVGRKIESLRFDRERRERELRETRLQQSLTEAELRALQAQINPHFLFNTLNTIADLIGSEPETAEAMTERLAEVFRYVLARSDRRLIPVSEELEFLRTYLAIEQTRFGDRLRVEMTLEPTVANAQIPPLLLQPLVENAIKHGLAPKREGGTLRIRARDEGQMVALFVEDDGVGWNETPSVVGNGIGLRNVRERLQTLYEDRATLTIHKNGGTQIVIAIPKNETQNFARGRRIGSAVAVA